MGLLFDATFERMWAFVRRSVSDTATAQDVVQDVFVKVQSSIGGYDVTRPLIPWMYGVASNTLRDHWRKQSREIARESLDVVDEAPPSRDPGMNALVGGDRLGELEAALQDLPEDLRIVVELRIFQDLSYTEISSALGLSEPAVRKRFSRALSTLRSSLDGAASSELA